MRKGGPPWCHHLHHLHLYTRQIFIAPRPATSVSHSQQVKDFPGLLAVHGNDLCWLLTASDYSHERTLVSTFQLNIIDFCHHRQSKIVTQKTRMPSNMKYQLSKLFIEEQTWYSLIIFVCGLNQRKYGRGLTSLPPGPATHHEGGNKCSHQPLYCHWYTSSWHHLFQVWKENYVERLNYITSKYILYIYILCIVYYI